MLDSITNDKWWENKYLRLNVSITTKMLNGSKENKSMINRFFYQTDITSRPSNRMKKFGSVWGLFKFMLSSYKSTQFLKKKEEFLEIRSVMKIDCLSDIINIAKL